MPNELHDILDDRDLPRLTALLAEHPELAGTKGVLNHVAMLRFNHRPRDLPGTGAVVQALIDAGAPVDGHPGDRETPLITAASYGDAEVAAVLLDAGADVNAVSTPDSGGIPSGTPLQHAAVYGMTDVLDVLVAAGARVDRLEMAAAAGDIGRWPLHRFPAQTRMRSLVFAADHQRLAVLDQLVAAGTPVNEADAEWQRMPLHTAAGHGRVASVRRLLDHGADPTIRDPLYRRTALEWAAEHAEVAALLRVG